MTPGFLTTASRRRLLGGVALLGAGPGAADASSPLDKGLLAAAAAFCALERRMLALIEGADRITDNDARDMLLRPLRNKQLSHLDLLCRQQARSLAGHRARAAAFALWDGGELARLAQANGFLADRLLAALIRDLADVPW